MGPTKKERYIEADQKIEEWQIILNTKRDFHIREVLLLILNILRLIVEDKKL